MQGAMLLSMLGIYFSSMPSKCRKTVIVIPDDIAVKKVISLSAIWVLVEQKTRSTELLNYGLPVRIALCT